jgi:hypothetical protein
MSSARKSQDVFAAMRASWLSAAPPQRIGAVQHAQSTAGQHVQFGKLRRHVSVVLGGSSIGPTTVLRVLFGQS